MSLVIIPIEDLIDTSTGPKTRNPGREACVPVSIAGTQASKRLQSMALVARAQELDWPWTNDNQNYCSMEWFAIHLRDDPIKKQLFAILLISKPRA